MTRYRLPEALGGGEIEAEEIWGGCAGGRPEYDLGGGMTIIAPAGRPLQAIPPPLPPEPPIGRVVLCCGEAVQRFEDNDLADDPSAHWASAGTARRWTWQEVVRIAAGLMVLLVPAPEPVELPWQALCAADGKDVLSVGAPDSDNQIAVSIKGFGGLRIVYLAAERAREAAGALWTAADAAEVQS